MIPSNGNGLEHKWLTNEQHFSGNRRDEPLEGSSRSHILDVEGNVFGFIEISQTHRCHWPNCSFNRSSFYQYRFCCQHNSCWTPDLYGPHTLPAGVFPSNQGISGRRGRWLQARPAEPVSCSPTANRSPYNAKQTTYPTGTSNTGRRLTPASRARSITKIWGCHRNLKILWWIRKKNYY